MALLAQFVLRLSFGLAAAMLLASPRQVTSGYYRNNLYVLLGLNALAALLAWLAPDDTSLRAWPAIVAAVASYGGAASWLYEKAGPGLLALATVAASSLAGAWLGQNSGAVSDQEISRYLWSIDPAAGGAVLGATMAAMLLGHWYLNAPGMSLAPLVRLTHAMMAVIVVRAALAALALLLIWRTGEAFDLTQWLFIAMRWLTGLVGALVVAVMARQTLKIPNTQSATGILYVGVILTFIGELTSLLLSRGKLFPL
ncbi:MAG TPA: hypothetical protein VFI31_24280 [Pirellulales bacterium]|nr:hypothetical protein [Pirellulales bacterium]